MNPFEQPSIDPTPSEEKEDSDWVKVNAAIEQSYADEAAEAQLSIDEVHSSPQCEGVSRRVVERLKESGIQAEAVMYSGFDITNHDFVLAVLDGDEWIIDGTWQQFLAAPDASAPTVLKARAAEVEVEVERLGIPVRWKHIWPTALASFKRQKADESGTPA